MPGILGPAIAGGVIGLSNLIGTHGTNNRLEAEAKRNRRFQVKMTAAKYPLAEIGMKAAGLNPMLYAQSAGGNTPSGSMAQGFQNPGQAISNGVMSAVSVANSLNNMNLQDTQSNLNSATEQKTKADTALSIANLSKIGAEIDNIRASTLNALANTKLTSAKEKSMGNDIILNNSKYMRYLKMAQATVDVVADAAGVLNPSVNVANAITKRTQVRSQANAATEKSRLDREKFTNSLKPKTTTSHKTNFDSSGNMTGGSSSYTTR